LGVAALTLLIDNLFNTLRIQVQSTLFRTFIY